MRTHLTAAIACLGLAAPATATSLPQAMDMFCVNVRRHANSQGLSAAPGTAFATIVAARANQSASDYALAWMLAKNSNNSNCRRMY